MPLQPAASIHVVVQLIVVSQASEQTSRCAQLSANVSLGCPSMPGPGNCSKLFFEHRGSGSKTQNPKTPDPS